eukprot:CAMPEP_0174385652 /NCGR_PEP_ID=MMETSP0811_2-20130205/126739_1 /TAXON_ID=73025 ORGANISM="Eutreptiella gymnastica-like, Strain CCMP1594" /NCGR_SAMPLE_ID=MMETSP0811_2 /ASSEMBLY_ACC=CAM_ASM_000667 /LENGTH=95 /DNA_ID=CAMNT_0015540035 /DNA_START=683 /DNA_END=970 /DNA_ORIENTATION=+
MTVCMTQYVVQTSGVLLPTLKFCRNGAAQAQIHNMPPVVPAPPHRKRPDEKRPAILKTTSHHNSDVHHASGSNADTERQNNSSALHAKPGNAQHQ